MAGWALINGQGMPLANATIPVTDVGFTHGFSVFETLLAGPGLDPTDNLVRMRQSAEQSGIELPPDELIRNEIDASASAVGAPAVVRITITGDGTRVVTATPVDRERWNRPIRCATGAHRADPFVGGSVKHRSRMGWMVAVRQAEVDEVLFVDHAGRLTEGTSCAVLAVQGGRVLTAAWDGRILESTTLRRLLQHCAAQGIPVVREGPLAMGPWEALYVASTTRGIAPVAELDGRSLPGWDPVGTTLRDMDAARIQA